MNRQYIGARYVPKFFNNNGSNDWVEGIPYESLVIVTDLNNSYTSYKPVPSNIGRPSANPDYWVCTGNYNAQVEEYRQDVEEYTERAVEVICTPEDYGAKGDGVTDDTVALKNAIENSNSVMLKRGSTYLISEQIAIPSNTFIYGNGTIKIANNSAITGGVFRIAGKENITIDSVIFDSNVSNQDTFVYTTPDEAPNIVIFTTDSNNVTVKKCKFIGCYSINVLAILYNGILNITDNDFICGSASLGFTAECVSIAQIGTSGNINIEHNTFKSTISDFTYGYGGVILANCVGLQRISDNKFEKIGRNSTGGQQVSPIDLYIDCHNVVIENNKLDDCYWFTRIINATHVIVQNNIFNEEHINSPDGGLVLVFVGTFYGTPQDLFDIKISNNYIKCLGDYPAIALYSNDNDHCVYDSVISGNTIEAGQNAIKIAKGCHDIIISNNTFKALDNFAVFLAVEYTNSATVVGGNYNVEGNVIKCNGGYVIYSSTDIAENSTPNLLSNNTIECDLIGEIKDKWVVSGNIINKKSDTSSALAIYSQQGSNLMYFINNVINGNFSTPTGTGVIESGDYYNGVVNA